MTDKVESDKVESAQGGLSHLEEHASSSEVSDKLQDALVTVELPMDVVAALSQLSHELGQTQNQVILEALRSTLGIGNPPPEPALSDQTQRTQQTATSPSTPPPTLDLAHLQTELERFNARLSQLETIIPKVAELEGKSIAF